MNTTSRGRIAAHRHPPSEKKRQRRRLLDVLDQRVDHLGGYDGAALETACVNVLRSPERLDGALEVLGALECVVNTGSDFQSAKRWLSESLGVEPDWDETVAWRRKNGSIE